MRKSITQNRLEYKKQIKRIKNIVTRAKKRGFEFDESYIAEITRMPQRVTKQAIQRIQSIRPENIYARSTYTTPQGEKITGTRRRTQERQEAALKSKQKRAKEAISDLAYEIIVKDYRITNEVDIEDYTKERKPQITALEVKLTQLYNEWIEKGSPSSFKNWLREEHPEIFEPEPAAPEPAAPEPAAPEPAAPEPAAPEPAAPEPAAPEPAPDDLPNEADLYIAEFEENIRSILERVSDEVAKYEFIKELTAWYNRIVSKYGRNEVARMLKKAVDAGLYISFGDVYDDEKLQVKFKEFLEYIDATSAANIMGKMEFSAGDTYA